MLYQQVSQSSNLKVLLQYNMLKVITIFILVLISKNLGLGSSRYDPISKSGFLEQTIKYQ